MYFSQRNRGVLYVEPDVGGEMVRNFKVGRPSHLLRGVAIRLLMPHGVPRNRGSMVTFIQNKNACKSRNGSIG